MHQRFPDFIRRRRRCAPGGPARFGRFTANEQALHRAAARHSSAHQARGKHARVVDDDEVARLKESRKVDDASVCDASGRAIQMKQPRSRTLGGWFLGDQLGREVEVEIADVHVRDDLIEWSF